MRPFKAHLRKRLQDEQFKRLFDEEKQLLRIGLEIAGAKAKLEIAQTEV